MIVQSKAPVRIDLAGGWTDVSIFAASAGGAVVNATINKYVHGRMYVLDTEDPVKRRVSGPSGKYVVESGAGEGIEVAYRPTFRLAPAPEPPHPQRGLALADQVQSPK